MQTCPLLIRVFTKVSLFESLFLVPSQRNASELLLNVVSCFKTGEHHTMEDYANRGKVPRDEVQIYTWMDATLRELTDLVS